MNNKTQIIPLGDKAVLVRFADEINIKANEKAIEFSNLLKQQNISVISEVTASLVSVLVSYDSEKISFFNLSGLLRLALSHQVNELNREVKLYEVFVSFDGSDIEEVALTLGVSVKDFIAKHNAKPLRVLTTGFAPGFIYCGMHSKELHIPRRNKIRPNVPKGTIIFAAGQTAIISTNIPTGWHVIGHSKFNNLDLSKDPPTKVNSGDLILFKGDR